MNPNEQLNETSHLFTLRIRAEPLGHGQFELRGQVRHVLTGETRYFREWTTLIAYVTERLGVGNEGGQSDGR
jgi:hypothetical protein